MSEFPSPSADESYKSIIPTDRWPISPRESCSAKKRRQCEVAHTSPLSRQDYKWRYSGLSSGVSEAWRDHAERRPVQKEHAAGRTRPSCARHSPRARADRTIACAAHRTDASGSGKPFIISGLVYTAKDRRVTRIRGPLSQLSCTGYRSQSDELGSVHAGSSPVDRKRNCR